MPQHPKNLPPTTGDLVRPTTAISFTDGHSMTHIGSGHVGILLWAGLTESMALFGGRITWWGPGELEVISHAH